MADRIVLTKCDFVTPAARTALARRLDTLNHQVARVQADQGALPPGCLFDLTTARDRGERHAALD